jgi:cell division protein FtsW
MKLDELLARQERRSNTRGRRSSVPTAPAVAAPQRNRRKIAVPNASAAPSIKTVLGAPDPAILAVMYALVGFGLVMVYSASSIFADRTLHDANALIRQQSLHALLACTASWVIGHYGDYRWLRRVTYPLLILTLGLLIATISGLGHSAGGAARWIRIAGMFRVQPAEIAKVTVICWLADSLAKKREHIRSFTVGFLPHALGAVLFMLLCLKQPDFGSAVMIGLLLFVMLFTAGARLGYLLGLGLLSLPLVYIAVAGSEYRMRRIAAFFSEAGSNNYQLWESQLSFGTGGIFGVGLGNSHQKLMYLPEAHTDFISSIIGEELGLIGVTLLVLAYVFLMYRGIRTALRVPDEYGALLCVGVSLFVGMQAFTNLAVAVGVLPTKGLVLPFISYGGSSLVVNCCAVALMSNVSRLQRAEGLGAPSHTSMATRSVGGVS